MRFLRSAVAVAMLFTVAACTPDEETPDPTPETAPATADPTIQAAEPEPSDEPTPSPESTELSDDQQAAYDLVAEHFTLYNEAMQDPDTDWQPLLDTTTGEAAQHVQDELEELQAIGAHREGDAEFLVQDVGEVTDDGSSVVVTACTDSADSDIVIAETGESIVEIDGPLILKHELTLAREAEGDWLVAIRDNQFTEACA